MAQQDTLSDLQVLISVITVCLNAAATIAETAESIQSQGYSPLEWLVIDGGSTDSTIDIVYRFKKLRPRVIVVKGSSIYEAMNLGIQMARGSVAGFLNADDCFATESALQTIADSFTQSRADCVYADMSVYSQRLKAVIRHWRPGPFVEGAFHVGWMAPHPTFYVRTSMLREHQFDSRLKVAADLKQQLIIFGQIHLRWFYVPVALVQMKSGGVSNRSLVALSRNLIEAASVIHPHSRWLQIRYFIRVIGHRLPQVQWKAIIFSCIRA